MAGSTPIVVTGGQDGLVDFIVPLEKLVPTDRGWLGLFASGTHQGKEISFKIMLAPGLRPGFVNERPDNTAFQEGGVLLLSDGAPTDHWLGCVAASWGMKKAGLVMAEQVPFTSFATHGDPRKLREEEIRFKLFAGSEEEGDYAEWFLHLNVPKGCAGFAEKDKKYRANLVLAMTGFRG